MVEKAFDITMRITKLTTMTFIKNNHNFLVFQIGNFICIAIRTNRNIEFLQGRYNELVMFLTQLIDQSIGILGGINTILFESIELSYCLRVQITTIHDK